MTTPRVRRVLVALAVACLSCVPSAALASHSEPVGPCAMAGHRPGGTAVFGSWMVWAGPDGYVGHSAPDSGATYAGMLGWFPRYFFVDVLGARAEVYSEFHNRALPVAERTALLQVRAGTDSVCVAAAGTQVARYP